MPRKRARLTPKKKSPKRMEIQVPGGLSQREFAALTYDYGSFIVEDSEHKEHSFALGDLAFVQYQELEDDNLDAPDTYWIGEVKEIRANRRSDVWVKVQWFWSPQEVSEVIKSFDPAICGKFEKLESDNCDIISVHCVVDHVDVKQFDETSIHQDFIEDDEWFSRYKFSYDGKRISPRVTHTACNICKVPYTPGEVKVHHFCPRPSCRKFYHQSCLIMRGYVEADRRYRLLETWPGVDRTHSVQDLLKTSPVSPPDIPPELIAVADQPILRGNPGGGIVGNIASVTKARSFIYEALTGKCPIPSDWETTVSTSAPLQDFDTLPNCFCPSCYSPI